MAEETTRSVSRVTVESTSAQPLCVRLEVFLNRSENMFQFGFFFFFCKRKQDMF